MIVYNNQSGLTNVYLGSTNIAKVYVSTYQVYPTGTKFQASYIGGASYSAACDGNTTLLKAQTRPSGYEYSSMTDVVIGDCITSVGRIIEAGYDSEAPFLMYESLSSVTIPDSVTTIGTFAFHTCSALSSITIPNSVTTIGAQAFYHCFSLSSITIPNSVTSIGDYAFESDALRFVEIGSGVTSIGEGAFQYCRSLTSITCNAIVPPTLDNYAFDDTNDCPIYVPCESVEAYKTAWSAYESRIQCVTPPTPTAAKFQASYIGGTSYSAACDSSTELTIGTVRPSGYEYSAMTDAEVGQCITSIGGYAFGSCTAMTSCTIPNSVTSIGNYAFSLCYSLSSVTIPDSVTSIGAYAFNTCSGLTSIDIPSGVTSIGDGTFEYCISMASCTIGSDVTSIGTYAFNNCSGLTSIDIPSGVTSIYENAFYHCSSLTSITCNAVTPPTLWGSYVFDNTNDCPIYVPCESLETYKTAWSEYASRIQCISPSFSGKWLATYQDSHTESAECDSISAITSGEITKAYLTDIQIGDCVTSISGYAFNNCTSLTSVTIGSSVTTIGQQAFRYCESIQSITIPDSVTSIGDQCFNYSTSLTSVTIGSGLTDIYNAAFEHCSSLTSVTIPNTVTRISAFAFEYCSGLTTVTIGSGVTVMGQDAFRYCSGLTSITVNAIVPPTLGNGTLKQFDDTNNCPIYVPNSSVNDYKASVGWQPYADRIQAIPNS